MTSTAAADLLLARRDLRFLLHDWLDVGALAARPRYAGQSPDDYDQMLDVAAQIAVERFAPHNRAADIAEPHLVDDTVVLLPEVGEALATLADAGLIAMSAAEEVGGLQLPFVLSLAASAWLHAANASTYAYAMLTTAAANMLAVHGTAEQAQRLVPPMIEGRWFGTMCLSEPQAGSSLADITTRAEPQDDGTYRIFGTKMWISGGEHELGENIVHLVLAKIPGGPPGVKGISLFAVPRYLGDDREPNDVTLAGLNHKLGYRGTVNTVLGFGEGAHTPGGRPGAVGELVGAPHQGLAYMFHMMNEARVAVGTCATALGYTGYLKALRYAQERPQGRPITGRDPAASPIPIVEHPDVRRMLLAQKAYVEGALGLVLYCGRLSDDAASLGDDDARRAQQLLELLTPIAKSWPSQWCLKANALAIQVHGGYGYSREYDVEQHYRDNRLNAIHEGTHGIQALDLLGRKVTSDDGAGLAELLARIDASVQRAGRADPVLGELAVGLAAWTRRFADVTATLVADPDRALVLAGATTYLEAAGHLVVAWLWLEQLLALDASHAEDFGAGKRAAAAFFFRYELPRIGPQLDLLAARDRTVLDADPAWL